MKKIILLLAIVLLFGCDGGSEKESNIYINCEYGEVRNTKTTHSTNLITNGIFVYVYYECYKKSGIGEKDILQSIHYKKTELK